MVAKIFLSKKQEDGSVVHRIDNKSRNNSVTNLICIDGALHSVYSSAFEKQHPYPPVKTLVKPGIAKT